MRRVYELLRVRTRDGPETTVYLVHHPLAATRVSVLQFAEPARLDVWCAATGHDEAMVAGFFVRDPFRSLGEVRIGGALVAHEPVPGPWDAGRACVHVDGAVRIAARLMISFGAREAINLDGGGSATLVHRGHLLNRPYSDDDQPAPSRGRSSPRCCSSGPERP